MFEWIVVVAMDDACYFEGLSQLIDGLKTMRVGSRCFMTDENIGFDPLKKLNILRKN